MDEDLHTRVVGITSCLLQIYPKTSLFLKSALQWGRKAKSTWLLFYGCFIWDIFQGGVAV